MLDPNPQVWSAEEATEELGRRLSKKLVGFDPTVIISIIVAVMNLISNKRSVERSPAAVQDCCRRRPLLTHVRIQQYLARQGVPLSRRGTAATALLDVGREAAIEEVVAFCNCCNPTPDMEE